MKKIILSLVFCAIASIGFAQDSDAIAGQAFGEGVKKGNIVPATEVNAKLGDATKAEMKVSGEVVTVCKKKGCFMKLKMSDGETMFVKFKDYGFFMPKDIEGKTVVVDGFAERKVTSVEDLKHYAEDAKKSPEEIAKITEPKKEIVFEAKGAVIVN
jgi:hypothetical protein